MSKKPWDYHEDLTRDRLQLVGKTLREVRLGTLLVHDPASGDTGWSLGCRIYARTCEVLSKQSGTLWPWLKVVKPALEFVFAIGDVPVRHYHGDAERPRGNHLRVPFAEQLQGSFAFGSGHVDLIWRMVVETNAAGETDRVVLIGTNPSGDISCSYEIPPLDDSVSVLTPRRPTGKPPVILPAPIVRPRRPAKNDMKDDDDGK